MKIYKHFRFAKWMRKARLTDSSLKKAIDEIKLGLVDADLGQGLLKKRVALDGRGKRGSVRTIIAFRAKGRAIFIYGFAKNEKASISKNEELQLKQLAKVYLSFTPLQISKVLKIGELIEVL